MVQRRSRRAQRKPPEVVPPKSDEEHDAEAGDANNTAESEEENDANTSATENNSRPRRRQKGRKPKGADASDDEDSSSDEGKSQENTDTGASSDEEDTSSAKTNQSPKRSRKQKKPTETDEAEKKTPRRRGRPRKNAEPESNDEEESGGEKETIRKSKRRNAGRRKQLDSSSSEDEQPKKVKRRRGRPRKNQDADDGDSKMETAEEESASDEESTKKVTRRRGRPRKNQDAEDNDSKLDSAEEESANEAESTKKATRRRGRPRKNQDGEDNDSKAASAVDESGSEDESTKKVIRRRGRPRKNQDADDSDLKMESASEEEPAKKVKRKRGRPRKNQDGEDSGSKTASAEEDEESGSDREATKKVTRRRGRPRKNQEVEDNDSKINSDNEESANEEEATNKGKRRRGRLRKKEESEDDDAKMANAEEESDDSGDEETETAEDASNDEITSTPTRRRRRSKKKSVHISSNNEGEKEEQSAGVKAKVSTRQTPDPSSNDEQSSEEDIKRKRSRSGRPQRASTEKVSNEANETPPRKRGRGRRSPPVSSSDDEPIDSNPLKKVPKSRLESINEASPAEPDSAVPSKTNDAQVPSKGSEDKPATKGEPKENATKNEKDGDGGSSPKTEPPQAKQESANGNGNSTETSVPPRRLKRQRDPPEQPFNDSEANASNSTLVDDKTHTPDAHEKKRPRTDLDEDMKDSNETVKSVAKPTEPSSNDVKTHSSPKTVETQGNKGGVSKNTGTKESLDAEDPSPPDNIVVADKKEAPPKSVVADKKEAPPKSELGPAIPPKKEISQEAKAKMNIVPSSTSDGANKVMVKASPPKEVQSKAEPVVTKPGAVPNEPKDFVPKPGPMAAKPAPMPHQQRELSSKVTPAVTKPSPKLSSDTKQVVTQANVIVEQNKAPQPGPNLSLDKNIPSVEKESSAKSVQPIKKVEASDVPLVQSPPRSSSLKNQDKSLTNDKKKMPEGSVESVQATSKDKEKKATLDADRASSIDASSPVKDAEMADVENNKQTLGIPQEETNVTPAGVPNDPKRAQSKSSESSRTMIAQVKAPSGTEGKPSAPMDTVASTAELASKSIPSETVPNREDTTATPADTKTEITDSREEENESSKNSSTCVESSPVTESSDDEDESESDGEEATPEPRFETKVLPFKPASVLPPTNKEQHISAELIENKVNRVKIMLYTVGSRVHRGRGFERLFSKYWDALTMRLSDRLSSHANRQCNAAIKAFLKSQKLRRIHNKLVLTLMKTSTKSFAPVHEISEYVPQMWHDKVKQVDRVVVEDGTKETKPHRKTRGKKAAKAARKHTTIYGEAWASIPPMEENPISSDCLKTESQEVDMKKIHASSASIPGALVIDPLVRDLSEKSNLRPSENAIWLLIVAAREHTSNILKNALKQKKDMENGEVSDPFLQYPRVIAGTKIPSKKDSTAEKNEQHLPAPMDYIPGKCQTRKVVTSFDIFASSLGAPAGSPAALGGSVSTTALELCLQNAYSSSSSFSGTNYSDVQKYIVEGIAALALDRKAMLLARAEEAKSNQVNLTNSQQQNATNVHNNVVSNARVRVAAPPVTAAPLVDMKVQPIGQAPQHQNPVACSTPASVVPKQQDKVEAIPSGAPANLAAAPSNSQAEAAGAAPGGLGRGAKDLASLMKRTPKPTDAPNPAPVVDDKGKGATESTPTSANPSPQKQTDKNDVDELGSSSGSGRRGKGFGTKNLAAMRARSSKPGEEQASPSRESVPATVSTNEPQKVSTNEPQKQEPNASARPTGGKDLAAMKGPAGAKDLAALRARSAAATAAAKASDETATKAVGTSEKGDKTAANQLPGETKPQGATESKPSAKELEASSKAAAPPGASVPTKPTNATPTTGSTPASDSKFDATNASAPADDKKADVTSSDNTKAKGDESDDSSVIVIESVKPPAQNLNKAAPSSEVKVTAAPNEKPTEEKTSSATASDAQPKPAGTTEKPNPPGAATDKTQTSGTADKKEAGASPGASSTDEVKGASPGAKEDGQNTSSLPAPAASTAAATSESAASKDVPATKEAETKVEATKSAENEKAKEGGAGQAEGTKEDESNVPKPEDKKVDESNAQKPEEKSAEASNPATKDEKPGSSK